MFTIKKPKKPTTDAVEILRRCFINTPWRKFIYYCWHKPQFWFEDWRDLRAAKKALKKGNFINLEDLEKELNL